MNGSDSGLHSTMVFSLLYWFEGYICWIGSILLVVFLDSELCLVFRAFLGDVIWNRILNRYFTDYPEEISGYLGTAR